MTIPVALLTAEQYAALPDDGRPTELVRGVVVPTQIPFPRHGQICAQSAGLLQLHLETHPVGRVVGRSGVITERNPDTVRGADLSIYSYTRMPRGRLPQGYLPAAPELILEVHSPGDRWREIHEIISEFLAAGVSLVCVLDQQTETAHVYHAEEPPREVRRDEELTLPEVLPDFRVPVRRFFE